MRLPPFQQGALDGLCGLYSIVNAEALINGYDEKRAQTLFKAIISFLHRRKRIGKIMLDGAPATTMLMLLKRAVKDRQAFGRVETPWRGVATPPLDEFWSSMQEFMGEGRTIITCLQGFHDHWTVIRGINRYSMRLHDSDGLKRLLRRECTTVKVSEARRIHVLRPAQTYFLSREGRVA